MTGADCLPITGEGRNERASGLRPGSDRDQPCHPPSGADFGVDLNNINNISTLLDDTHLPSRTLQDKARVTLRGLMFLRFKVWQELRQ